MAQGKKRVSSHKRNYTGESNKEKRDGLRVSFVLRDCNKMQSVNFEACIPVLEIWLFSSEI